MKEKRGGEVSRRRGEESRGRGFKSVRVPQSGGSDSGSCCFCGICPATPDNLHLSLPY